MRRESITGISATGLATCAKPRVTRTIGTRALDTLVVLPHLGFSFRVRQVDAHDKTSYVLEERGPVAKTDLASLFLRAPADTKKRGGVQEIIYRGEVVGGVQARLL